MPLTPQQTRAKIAENREADRERFEWHEELGRRRLDEITDQSERIAKPMVNSFEYLLTTEGLRSEFGESPLKVVRDGHQVAVNEAKINPNWIFEANRRRIEVEEQELIEAFARGEIDAEALVVLSPLPDAVRYDGINIGAYDKNRKKMIARVVTPLEDGLPGIRITSLSLDGSNYDGMRNIADKLGFKVSWSNGNPPASERVLGTRFWVKTPVDSHTELIGVVRESYDRSLADQYGGEWYAGRPNIDEELEDARTFIEKQSDLIDAHMHIVNRIFALTNDPDERNRLLKPDRYNFAAALDARLHGNHAITLQEAGDAARAEGRDYDGDCPTADRQMNALGYSGFVRGACPICGRQTYYDPCAPVCGFKDCPSNGGSSDKDVKMKNSKNYTRHRKNKPVSKNHYVNRVTEQGITKKEMLVVGGTKTVYFAADGTEINYN